MSAEIKTAVRQTVKLGKMVKCKDQQSTQCRACGTINISKYVHNFLKTNPTTLSLSSLVREKKI